VSFEAEVLLGRFRARGTRLIWPTIFLGITCFLATFLVGKLTEQWQQIAAYVVYGLILLLGFLVPVLRYLTAWTDLTSSRVVQRSGLFGQHFRQISYHQIERVELGAGRLITLYVAGEEAMELRSIPKTRIVAQEISRLSAK
jgi:membrane protein YdbS with pleckstrin-like domain